MYLENLHLFFSVDLLELDDTIDCLQDYKSLPPKESIAHFVTQKEILTTEESDDDL